MKIIKKTAVSLAAASLVFAPIASAAQPAVQGLATSLDAVRALSLASSDSKLEGESGTIVAILAGLAIIGGIVLAAGNNSDGPTSP
jgi:hypothetical protein